MPEKIPGQPRIRILPLLAIVAVAAFSVRLIDFAAGVSSLSGKAFAESASAPPASEDAPKADPESAAPDSASGAEAKPEPGNPGAEAVPKTPAAGDASEAAQDSAKQDSTKQDAAKDQPPQAAPAAEETRWRDAGDEEQSFENVRKEVFDDLAERRRTLDKREQDLTTREALLKAAEQELEMKYQELTQLRGRIEELLQTQSDEEKARVASLVKIYENMKPKEAARIFDTLDLDVLVGVVSQMSERRLSPILAAMNPERAKTVTIMLSEEKQLPSLPRME